MTENILNVLAKLCYFDKTKKIIYYIEEIESQEVFLQWLDKYYPLATVYEEQELWKIISREKPVDKRLQKELFDFRYSNRYR
ncbi:MAG: hypothetical protein Ta2B_10440 [Termitinemataceae bacterium]|nr:MAG: hypothetical protein Ta2B_10440 [Termitinemataceae bacterium]